MLDITNFFFFFVKCARDRVSAPWYKSTDHNLNGLEYACIIFGYFLPKEK